MFNAWDMDGGEEGESIPFYVEIKGCLQKAESWGAEDYVVSHPEYDYYVCVFTGRLF